jgi:hypothetical protein
MANTVVKFQVRICAEVLPGPEIIAGEKEENYSRHFHKKNSTQSQNYPKNSEETRKTPHKTSKNSIKPA